MVRRSGFIFLSILTLTLLTSCSQLISGTKSGGNTTTPVPPSPTSFQPSPIVTSSAIPALLTQVAELSTQVSVLTEIPIATRLPATTQIPETATQPLISQIQMVNSEVGWATCGIGGDGRLLRTEDGGATWVEAAPGIGPIHAIDEDTVVNRFGSFHTTDGYRAWDFYADLEENIDANFGVEGVVWQFLDEKKIWVIVELGFRAGGADAICATMDGGESWEMVFFTSTMFLKLRDIFMLDEYNGWLIAHKYNTPEEAFEDRRWAVYKTVDGGYSWNPVQLPRPDDQWTDRVELCYSSLIHVGAPDLLQISFTCYKDRYSPALGRWYYISADGGFTWRYWLMEGGCFFLDANTGWRLIDQFVGTAIVEFTDDGGFSWNEIGIAPAQGEFQFWNALEGWMVTTVDQRTEFWVTSDGGKSWRRNRYFPGELSITFLDRDNGWAFTTAGETNILWRTLDGGMTWEDLAPIVIKGDVQ
jgi:photosystem II stability/assembly factor-like uncharacterized protein